MARGLRLSRDQLRAICRDDQQAIRQLERLFSVVDSLETGGGGAVTDGDYVDITVSDDGATWTINPSGATPGSYTNASVTVGLDGRITAVSSGTSGGITELTGDVTAGPGSGSQVATIANGVVSNTKLADVTGPTFKGRVSGTGSPADLTSAEATSILDAFTSTLKGLAPASGGGTTNFLRADGTWAAPAGGGGDGWTYARISSDFSVSDNPAVDTDVPGMAFTPAASKNYEIEGRFLVTANATTNGVQVGAAWPTGLVTPSAVRIDIPNSPIQYNNINLPRSTNGRVTTQGTISTSLESLGLLWGMLSTDASPSGTFKITIKSEGNGQTATMKAGSFIRYREIPI